MPDLYIPESPQAGSTVDAPPAPAPAASSGGYVPGGYLSQQTYLDARDGNPDALKAFLKDWIAMGGRGIEGGDGQPASYWDVYNDMAANGVDVSDLPAPDDLPQGTAKGGGVASALSQPAATAGAPPAGPSPELTDLLKRMGVDYPNAPAATPALLAFLRGVGLNLSTAEDVQQKAIQRIQQHTTDTATVLGRKAEEGKRNITGDLIRRGVLQSGEANTRYSNQAADVAQRYSDLYRAQTEGIENADLTYRQAQDAARQQALEQVISTEKEQALQKATSDAQAEAYRKQQEAADVAYQRQTEAMNQTFAKQEELLKKYGVAG